MKRLEAVAVIFLGSLMGMVLPKHGSVLDEEVKVVGVVFGGVAEMRVSSGEDEQNHSHGKYIRLFRIIRQLVQKLWSNGPQRSEACAIAVTVFDDRCIAEVDKLKHQVVVE